jgi:hypothetical protein
LKNIFTKKYQNSRAFSVGTIGTTDYENYFSPSIITNSKISPVLPVDFKTYKYLNMCDCSLLPNCLLGDGIPLNNFEEQHQQQKYKRKKLKRKIFKNNLSSSPRPSSSSTQSSIQRYSSSSSQSLLSTSSDNEEKEEFIKSTSAASFLFRLPLKISKINHKIADCKIQVDNNYRRRRHCKNKLKPINFTDMGLFIAPLSDTDPDEAFVVVEKRRLFVKIFRKKIFL